MSTVTLNKNAATIVASATNSAGATTRGTIDLRSAQGAIVSVQIQNGATGPTAPCVCNILIAHDDGATPAAGSAGSVWKLLWAFAGGTVNNGQVPNTFEVSERVQHLCIEFTGNTGQGVTVEAFASKVTSGNIV